MTSRHTVFFVLLAILAAPMRAVAADPPSIYEFIQSHVDPATGSLSAEAATLPDEPAARRYSRLRWVPGALEGLGTRHMQWDGSEKASRATRLLELIAAGNDTAESVLYELLRADDVVTFYSAALDLASERIRDPEPQLHDLARRFALTAKDRGPVKFAIAILGSIGDEQDLPLVQTLALHDEFGLYAAEAIAEIAPDPQAALYDMARKVTGWGRVEAVTKMVATSDPLVRRWLLTEGFRNTVNPQYLAFQCATIANLAGALADSKAAPMPDTGLLVGAADLIMALVKPGPGAGLDKYTDAPGAAESFLQLIQKRRDSVSFFLAARALNDYAAKTDITWEPEQRSRVKTLATGVIGDSGWRRHVVAAIGDDRADLDEAERAARELKLETFELHLRRLVKHPVNPKRWSLAFVAAKPAEVARLVDVAERAFSTTAGGSQKAIHSGATLEAVLQGIASYPGSGMHLVETSLADGDERVRRAAVETLVRWGSSYLRDASVRTALNDAARGESDEALKARMVALLNLGTLP